MSNNELKIEEWNGCEIRFASINGEWWAVLKDIADALELRTDKINERLDRDCVKKTVVCDAPSKVVTSRARKTQEMLIVNEIGIYDAIFQSRKPEAKEFRHWVYGILKELRNASGLEGFEIFKSLDKEFQKLQMTILLNSLRNPARVDFIKANVIANKAVSNKYGFNKMVKKGDMGEEMLKDRECILEDTVNLMTLNERYNMGLSVSEQIYRNYREAKNE